MTDSPLDMIRNSDPGILDRYATLWDVIGDGLEGVFQRYVNEVGNVQGASWEGEAATAAHDRATADQQSLRTSTDQLTSLSERARTGSTTIAEALRTARGYIANCEAEGWNVSPQLVVTGEGNARDIAQMNLDLTAAYNAVVAADVTVRDALNDIGGLLAQAVPGDGPAAIGGEPLTGEQGREDGETIADGMLSDAESARIVNNLLRAGLTESQLAALARGEDVTIPQSAMDYLEALYANAGRDGLLDVSEKALADGSPQALQLNQNLVNGMLMLSNENVVTRGPDGRISDRGGYDKLNSEVRELVGTRPDIAGAPDSNTRDLPDDYRAVLFGSGPIDARHGVYEYTEDLGRFGNFLAGASPEYIPGDRLGVELQRQASHQAWIIDNGGYAEYSGSRFNEPEWLPTVDHAAQDLLTVGTRNHDSNYALLTGNGSDELFGKGTPGQTYNEYSFDEMIAPAITHDWPDGGKAMGGMFSWTGEDATSANPETATRAGEAATVVSNYLVNNFDHLTDLEGPDTLALGERNPELLRGMSESLRPFIPELAGVPDAYVNTVGFERPDDSEFLDNAQKIFAVMNTDQSVSEEFNAHALISAAELQSHWLNSALADPTSPDNPLAIGAGAIQGLVDRGLQIELDDRTRDGNVEAATGFANKGAAYDAIKGVLSAGIKYTPVIGPVVGDMASNFVSPAVDIANTYVKNAQVGIYSVPEPPSPRLDSSLSTSTPSQQMYQFAKALEANAGNIPHETRYDKFFDDSGRLKDYNTLRDEGIDYYDITAGLDNLLRNYNDGVLMSPLDRWESLYSDGWEIIR
ncbi:WXG100 family type VII secretion target [Nocardia otitidiscaviarum]|uniref:WXG100 family type VII secretion target n=1 Tax=Nocardia otitidiscaviarum TaxID=1823 RepID=UPI002456DD08|nr:hypothetical protein [Nocardia otitidiscaviarum]